MDSDPLAILIKKGETYKVFVLLRRREAALKGEQYVEGEQSKSGSVHLVIFVIFVYVFG